MMVVLTPYSDREARFCLAAAKNSGRSDRIDTVIDICVYKITAAIVLREKLVEPVFYASWDARLVLAARKEGLAIIRG